MAKKGSSSSGQLGRAIIRDRFGGGRGRQKRGDPTSVLFEVLLNCHCGLVCKPLSLSLLQVHTSDLQDGYDWGRLNLQSVTEQSQLNEFLATAELAGTEFAV